GEGEGRGPGGLEARLLWSEAGAGAEGRIHRLGRDGRSQCFHPDPSTGPLPAHVRGPGEGAAGLVDHVRVPGGGEGQGGGQTGSPEARRAGPRLPEAVQAGHGAERVVSEDGSRSRNLRGQGRWGGTPVRAGEGAPDGPEVLSLLRST